MLVEGLGSVVKYILVYRARPSLPRMILLSHALNYKRVWRGGRSHEALTNQIAVHVTISRSSCQVGVMKINYEYILSATLSRRATRAYNNNA